MSHYLAFAKDNRLVAFMGSDKMNPLIISKKSDTIPSDLFIEMKQDMPNIDSLIDGLSNIDSFLEESKIEEPNVYVSLTDETIERINQYYEDINESLDKFIQEQPDDNYDALNKAKLDIIGSGRVFFLLDLKKKSMRLSLENISSFRTNEKKTKIVSRGRLYGHYTYEPIHVTQDDGVYVVESIDTNEYPTICFELDLLDLYLMLSNNLNIIGLLDGDKNTCRLGTDSLQVNDYICFYSDENENKSLSFYCLLLPSYLK